VATDFVLEQRLAIVSPPSFRGLVGLQPVVVELDNSATYKLAGKARGTAIPEAIEAGHSRIQAAAARLLDIGDFQNSAADGVRHIQLSALDLD
jgi:hypothetical protein